MKTHVLFILIVLTSLLSSCTHGNVQEENPTPVIVDQEDPSATESSAPVVEQEDISLSQEPPVEDDRSSHLSYVEGVEVVSTTFKGQECHLILIQLKEELETPETKQKLLLDYLLYAGYQDQNPSSAYYIGAGMVGQGLIPVYLINIRQIRSYIANNLDRESFVSSIHLVRYDHQRTFFAEVESRVGEIYYDTFENQPMIITHYFPHPQMIREEMDREILFLLTKSAENPRLAAQDGLCILALHFQGEVLHYISKASHVLQFIRGEISLSQFEQNLYIKMESTQISSRLNN